jgi:hypothetical protein
MLSEQQKFCVVLVECGGGEVGGVGVERSLIPSTKWSVHGRPVEALTPTTSVCIFSIIVP